MFTGLIEKVGTLCSRDVRRQTGAIAVKLHDGLSRSSLGESIAVNGVCLTLAGVSSHDNMLLFDVLAETFSRSNLGKLPMGASVNVEQALIAGGRLGGHIVQGHVDCVGTVASWKSQGRDKVLTIAFPESQTPYLIEKGSVAVDGVSLTIARIGSGTFDLHLIPTTCETTCLGSRGVGAEVNLETDMLGKYAVNYLRALGFEHGGKVGLEELRKAGWPA